MELEIYQSLIIALLLGLLVGFQREWSENQGAGIRTFALITLFGAITSLLARSFGGWIVAAGAIATALILIMATALRQANKNNFGITTEMAAMVMFGVGALAVEVDSKIAIVLGGVTAVLLHWKAPLHNLAKKIGEADLKAIMQFVVIGLVVLPLLPNQTFGPYDVLNPYQIWLLVVLIVTLSLGGYIAYRAFGEKTGSVLGGILGGLISSTATTVSYAKQAKHNTDASLASAFVILVASTILNVRVLIEIGIVSPEFLQDAAPPFIALASIMTIQALVLFVRIKNKEIQNPSYENPAQLKTALIFGFLYAIIMLAIAASEDQFGNRGIFLIAAISGLTDVDAITLSTAEIVNTGRLTPYDGWRVIVVATLSNLVFKAGLAGVLGGWKLFKYVGSLFGLTLVGGVLILLFWPTEGFF